VLLQLLLHLLQALSLVMQGCCCCCCCLCCCLRCRRHARRHAEGDDCDWDMVVAFVYHYHLSFRTCAYV
jgi:hypothetical protein